MKAAELSAPALAQIANRSGRPLRILLVRSSPVARGVRGPMAAPVAAPLGVLYLTAALRQALGDAVVVEAASLSTEVETESDIASFVAGRAPDVVGISASLADEDEAATLVEAARRLDPPALTILGGPYPTCAAERALDRTDADLAVAGEAEHTIVALIETLLAGREPWGVPGVVAPGAHGALRASVPAELIADLDTLALPAWDAIPIEAFTRLRNHNDWPPLQHPYAPILTSRGCPYCCSYCHNIHGRRYRARSPDNVLREVELLHHRHGVRELHVVDDIFNLDGPRMEAICRGLIQRGLGISIAFPNALRGELLTRPQLELLRDAGCYSINVSLESASPRILERMRRKVDLDRLAQSIRTAVEVGLMVGCFVMFGYPGETPEDLELTFEWLRRSWVDFPRHAIVAPFPGTEAAAHARERGLDPAVMESGRGSYEWANAGLADMPPEEFKRRIHDGLQSIAEEPRRQRRMRELWQRWPETDIPLMGHPPPAAEEP
ncbi:MAG: B12-binding domain-containing radical SAM protein [Deltaproteobacteria bacterium]|jgi:radical SAM superfamily enzyme YgiQ (UPF0313 family)|nr:B12-binding domain-containing radical SAM protein [Deltaproteobacteria bacterium]MBW2533139.1 B12-binding domain-containing radical SAM protein [Deltaproteobacteria bacterium]